MQFVGMRGEVEESFGAVVDRDGEGVFWRSSIIHTHEDCLRLLHRHPRPIPVVSCITETEATAVEVDDDRELVRRVSLQCWIVVRG